MDITRILTNECTRAALDAASRKRALEAAAELLAAEEPALSSRMIFDELMARERLGSTGLGEGVAIPHCRIPCEQVHGAFLSLKEAVDYDAIDGEGVDLLFVLIVPPKENSAHLDVLAGLAGIFGDAGNRDGLRSCTTDAQLYERISGLCSSQAA